MDRFFYNLKLDIKRIWKYMLIVMGIIVLFCSIGLFSNYDLLCESKELMEPIKIYEGINIIDNAIFYSPFECEIEPPAPAIDNLINVELFRLGLFVTVICSALVCVISVGRERFFTNWWWTLMRVPKYRLGYFVRKILITIFPILFYLICQSAFLKWYLELYESSFSEEQLSGNPSEHLWGNGMVGLFFPFEEPIKLITVFSVIIVLGVSIFLCVSSLAGSIKRYFIRFAFSVTGFAVLILYATGKALPFAVMPVLATALVLVSIIGLYSKNN